MLKTQGLTPVTTEQGLAVARKMNAAYMECSSKEMTGVEDIFEQAILTVVANDRKNLEAQAALGNGNGGSSQQAGVAGRFGGSGPGGAIPIVAPVKKKKRSCKLL
jgi:hypothetical protein